MVLRKGARVMAASARVKPLSTFLHKIRCTDTLLMSVGLKIVDVGVCICSAQKRFHRTPSTKMCSLDPSMSDLQSLSDTRLWRIENDWTMLYHFTSLHIALRRSIATSA
jgi:hypothetical protein